MKSHRKSFVMTKENIDSLNRNNNNMMINVFIHSKYLLVHQSKVLDNKDEKKNRCNQQMFICPGR